jgi:hypothetical protein
LDGLGIDADAQKKPPAVGLAPVAAPTPATARTKSVLGDDEDNRPAKSVMDGLLGRGKSTAASLLETKDKPKTFVLDKKYTQPKEGEIVIAVRIADCNVIFLRVFWLFKNKKTNMFFSRNDCRGLR